MSNIQNDFLAAIILGHDQSVYDVKALAVYRNNLYACAIRSLEISYPTLYLLCGHDFFQKLALAYLKENPFTHGDWGEWGGGLGKFVDSSNAAEDYPFFSSIAELDWLVHKSERCADQKQMPRSFQLLASPQASECRLVISDLVATLESKYPIVDIYKAHHFPDDSQHYMALARDKIAQQEGQNAIVFRPLLKSQVEECELMDIRLMKAMTENRTLGDIVEELPDSFDFEQWLAKNVEMKIVLGVCSS